ncbi:MAG: 2-deoxy-D-gluconate 3-dehydrogenase [Treponema sp. GWB1_62_6]|nr:MAG: 2-deoxy-D-gluconate 3-dehydrogenase [Treponema sp. GWA1_62_8]OHE63233.1 MAG: 2-deoxy-D-gluconate 3-dehydrogenase [Treponema sp. GWB1_62_6]OHE69925.1 MAG: 2-deoxy-D-gluconate 3-dehydrogenase [Treponema sp. GWC1_61_84]OHE70553.1 MAG: 2-deoxy-D-gluconate 3-dehydrogenase [Treponema sp. RIFOXYC1_FULL_61_9]HCM28065.1 2-deoxy-D-gluconate 3-dehydrogenase [Treponema sp.]
MISSLFEISGKKAIVTGGTRGLGHGMAEALLEAGCEVSIIGSSDQVKTTAGEFNGKGFRCHGVKADLRERKEVYSSFEEALLPLGGDLDILVTAAGIQRRHSAEDFPIEEWDEVLSINLHAVFIQCQLAGRIMLKKGYGKIINVASMACFFGGQTIPAYSAAKGGVMQLTKEMSNDWVRRGVCVNSIAPGYMDTEMNSALIANETRNRQITERIPAGRWGTEADVKGITIFLASAASDYVSGAVIPVDGGYLVK